VGSRTVQLCHGSPRKVNEFLWESTTPHHFVSHLCQGLDADAIGTHRAQPGDDYPPALRPAIICTHLDSSPSEMLHFQHSIQAVLS